MGDSTLPSGSERLERKGLKVTAPPYPSPQSSPSDRPLCPHGAAQNHTHRLESLEQAKANASYSVYVPDNEPEVNIPIAGGVTGRVIRVQLEGTGYLSISELQAYELSFLPLSK